MTAYLIDPELELAAAKEADQLDLTHELDIMLKEQGGVVENFSEHFLRIAQQLYPTLAFERFPGLRCRRQGSMRRCSHMPLLDYSCFTPVKLFRAHSS